MATNIFHPLRGRWVALLSIGIIFVYRIGTLNLPLSGIPTLSMTNLFIIWLICVKTCVYKVARFAWTPFTSLSVAKTTRNTPHSSAVFPCIPIGLNRWHLLIENRWSRLYAAWSAAPLALFLSRTAIADICSTYIFLCWSGLRYKSARRISEDEGRKGYEELKL